MFELGTEPRELERCLSECRKPLIAAGAKADNLPKGLDQQAKFVENLSLKAEELICSWFKKNADFSGCGDAGAAAERLLAEPHCVDKAVWRTVLRAFLLREQLPSVTLWLSGAAAPLSQSPPSREDLGCDEVALEETELFLSIATGEKQSGLQTPMPMLLAGVIAAAKGDAKGAAAWISRLEAINDSFGMKLAETVAAVLRHAVPAIEPMQAPLLASGMAPEVDHLPFIGVVKRILPTGQMFVSLAALKVDGVFYEVSPTLARQIFPETGDATVFSSNVHKPYLEGEIGLWTAERGGAEHLTRCVVDRSLPRPFLPVRVPHPSSEPDLVREWMLHSYTVSPLHLPLFLLADGLAVRLPSGQHDPSRVDFDIPLDGFRNVKWIELAGAGISFVSDLPAEVERLDCAPPATLVKRLFKRLRESEAAPMLTRAEIQTLAELASVQQEVSGFQLNRAMVGLKAATGAKVLLKETSAELFALPAVQEIIEAEKNSVVAAHAAEVQQAQESLNQVVKKKQALESELEQLRNSIRQERVERKKSGRQQEADFVRRLRAAFEKASQDGVETLAQAAVFKVLLQLPASNEPGQEAGVGAACASMPASSAPEAAIGPVVDSVRGLRRTVEACAELSGLNEMLLVSTVAAARSSPVIGIAGCWADPLIQALADVVTGGLKFRASVAQDMFNMGDLMRSPAVARQAERAWALTVGDCLLCAAAADVPAVIELRGANRAPLEALLPELLDCGLGRAGISWLDGAGMLRHAGYGCHVIWVLTFADGKTVFPIPDGLARSMPLLSTDGWPSEPKQLEQTVVTTIASNCWKDLCFLDGRAQPSMEEAISQMRSVMEMLKIDSRSAATMASLALATGRRTHAEAVAAAIKEGGVVAAYAEGLESCTNALQKLFGIEGV